MMFHDSSPCGCWDSRRLRPLKFGRLMPSIKTRVGATGIKPGPERIWALGLESTPPTPPLICGSTGVTTKGVSTAIKKKIRMGAQPKERGSQHPALLRTVHLNLNIVVLDTNRIPACLHTWAVGPSPVAQTEAPAMPGTGDNALLDT